MSRQHAQVLRRCVLVVAVTAGLGFLSARSARADDLLDRIASQQKVAAQQAASDIKNCLALARKLEGTNPARAKESLAVAEFLLDDAKGLSEQERATFAQQIQQIRRQIQASQRERGLRASAEADRTYLKEQQTARQRELETKSGYKGTVGQAKGFIETGKGALGEGKAIRQKMEQGFLAVNRDVMESASRMVEERFTKHWLWVLEHRKSGPQLTQAEKDLLKMLNSTLSVDFKNHTLKQAIEYLQDKTDGKLQIFVDELSLKEVDVDYDSQVTFKAKKVTVRSVLKKVLADKGLTFIIKEAAVHVMTPAKAKEHMVVRTYPVQDLLGTANPRFGPMMNRAQQMYAAQQLMQIIVNQVEPASWQINGGAGSIVFDAQRMALVIRNTAEWHYQMNGLFGY